LRPPLAGTQKPAFCADGLMSAIDTRLPKHPTLSNGQASWSLPYANAVFKNMGNGTFWNDLCTDSSLASNNCVPNDALDAQQGDISTTSQGYGSPRAMAITGAMAVTMQTGSAAAKYPVVWKIVQVGIDAWGARKAGKCWFADGGIHNGWKIAILYAGHMLDSATLLAAATGKDECFQEDGHTYESSIQSGLYLWGREDGCLKSAADAVGAKQTRWCPGNQYDNRDGGAQWTSTCGGSQDNMQLTPAQQISQGCYSITAYQQHTHNYIGQVAVVRNLLGADREQTWGHRPFFAVWDRIAAPPWNGACSSYCSNFLKNFYLAYGKPDGTPPPPPTPRLPSPALE
jgi:hypothetical protein